MSSFATGLWNSVFQPGTTPQLIIATHCSFVALLVTLMWLIYATSGNIHFFALFFIALLLWGSVIWFIQELKGAKLMSNEELMSEEKKGEVEEDKKVDSEKIKKDEGETTGRETTPSKTLKSRKV